MREVKPRIELCSAGTVPETDHWLGPREKVVFAGLTRPHRRSDWRAGRWAAKRAVVEAMAELDGRGLARVEVLAHPDGSPHLYLDGEALPLELSISHRDHWAVVAAGSAPLGIDLELLESRSERFVRDFFTEREVDRYFDLPPVLRDLYSVGVWSAKEGVLKCARTGLRRDTRSVEVDLEPSLTEKQWRPLFTRDLEQGTALGGWWVRQGVHLITIVSPAPLLQPEPLPTLEAAPPSWRPGALGGGTEALVLRSRRRD